MEKKYSMEELKNIIADLRGENGCPWDKKQTHESLIEYLIEESYEVIDAIKKENIEGMCEELGDVLLQVVLHSQIASENNEFNLEDVISIVTNKMIDRHPHVFGDFKPKDEEDLKQNWEKIKKQEKGYRSTKEILNNIPDCLPALLRSYKVQKKADKYQEIKEDENTFENVKNTLKNLEGLKETEKAFSEYGKLLFEIVALGKQLKINPELALTEATDKYIESI